VEFEKVCTYLSVAVVRDPYHRFPSSVSQRLSMYGPRPIHKLSKREIRKEIGICIDYLLAKKQLAVLPKSHIHFQRQSTYIFEGTDRIVDRLYTVDQVSDLLADIGKVIEEPITEMGQGASKPGKLNVTSVYRSPWIGVLLALGRPLLEMQIHRVIPKTVRSYLKSIIYVPRDRRLEDVFDSIYVREFIEEYYSADLKMFEEHKVESGCLYGRFD